MMKILQFQIFEMIIYLLLKIIYLFNIFKFLLKFYYQFVFDLIYNRLKDFWNYKNIDIVYAKIK